MNNFITKSECFINIMQKDTLNNIDELDWESIRSSPRDGFRGGWLGVLGGVVGIK